VIERLSEQGEQQKPSLQVLPTLFIAERMLAASTQKPGARTVFQSPDHTITRSPDSRLFS
jgi:hypothetical protein